MDTSKETHQLNFRKIDVSDTQEIVQYLDLILSLYEREYRRPATLPYASDWRQKIITGTLRDVAHEDVIIYVAVAGDHFIVGALACTKRDLGSQVQDHDKSLNINEVAVLPKYWGKGIATRLVKLCEEEARADGIKSMTLFTNTDNFAAHALYVKTGFVDDYTYMVKRLTNG